MQGGTDAPIVGISQKVRELINEDYGANPELFGALYSTGISKDEYKLDNPSRPIFHRKPYPKTIPESLQAHISKVQYKTFAGLFPEINRAYITVDSTLFLWDYEQDDYVAFDCAVDTILSVALVRPKHDVFVESVQYLLAIATTVQVLLCAVVISPDGEISIGKTHYNVSTDNVNMQKVLGTKNGRIFLCGSDGCLYEVDYSLQDGWFRNKIRKMNRTSSNIFSTFLPFLQYQSQDGLADAVLDETRNILYTLTSKSAIQVFYLGAECDKMEKVVEKKEIIHDVRKIVDQDSKSPDWIFEIIHLAPIPVYDSHIYGLVAISKAGLRYYFSVGSDDYTQQKQSPGNLQLRHIRIPPQLPAPFDRNLECPSFHTAFYSTGVTFLIENATDVSDYVLAMSPSHLDKANLASTFSEVYSHSSATIGKVWEIAEISEEKLVSSQMPTWAGRNYLLKNELALPFQKPPRHFALFSGRSIEVVVKLRPIDELRLVLSQDIPALEDFQKRYGDKELCCMLAILAAGLTPVNEIGFSYYDFLEPQVVSLALKHLYSYGGQPVLAGRGNVTFSPLHDGPIFDAPLVQRAESNNEWAYKPTFTARQYLEIHNQLSAFERFLDRHKLAPIKGKEPTAEARGRQEHAKKRRGDEASMAEEESLSNLHILIIRSIEALNFLGVLQSVFHMSDVCKMLSTRAQNVLLSLEFLSFVSTGDGSEMHKELVNALVMMQGEFEKRYLGSVADFLSSSCPSWLSDVDQLRIKGLEYLNMAHKMVTADREAILNSSLTEFLHIPEFINKEQGLLLDICEQYAHLLFFTGVVELSLKCAQAVDPQDLCTGWLKNNSLPEDSQSQILMSRREECYTPIWRVLSMLTTKEEREAMNLTAEAFHMKKAQVFDLCKNSKDEAFHYLLYQWHVRNHLERDLIKMKTPYLEEFLKKMCTRKVALDLLWKYYVSENNYAAATLVLMQQAELPGHHLTLNDRVSLLARALANCKGAKTKEGLLSGATVKGLQDRMELAQIQRRVYAEMNSFPDPRVREAVHKELNERLFDISELYNKFASKYSLFESALAILKAGSYSDPNLVDTLWRNLIDDKFDNQPNTQRALDSLKNHVLQIGTEHYPSEVSFPVEKIISYLEDNSFDIIYEGTAIVDRFWVSELMLKIGVEHRILFPIYSDLFERETSPTKRKHIGLVLLGLVASWTAHLSSVAADPSERKYFEQVRGKVQPFTNKVKEFVNGEVQKKEDKGKDKDAGWGTIEDEDDEHVRAPSRRMVDTVEKRELDKLEKEITANLDRLKRGQERGAGYLGGLY